MKKALSAVLIIATVFMMTSCTTYNNFKTAFFGGNESSQTTVRIGVYEPLTGKNATLAKDEIAGIELAHEMNSEVLGMQVELVYADNKSNMYEAETAIDTLLKSNPQVILGSYGETLTLMLSDYLKSNRIPGITITSTNPLITENNEYFFSSSYIEAQQGTALCDFACNSQEIDKAAVITVKGDDTYNDIIKRFKSEYKTINGSEVNCRTYKIDPDTKDFTSVIESIKESEVKAIFVCLSAANANDFLNSCVENELTSMLFLGTSSLNDENVLKTVQSEDLHFAYIGEQAKSEQAENYDVVLEAYHEKYGSEMEPSSTFLTGYDAYMIALKGIEDAYSNYQNTSFKKESKGMTEAEIKGLKTEFEAVESSGIPSGRMIKDAIRQINAYKGLSGEISYDGDNEITKAVVITHLRGETELAAYISK